MPLSDNTVWSKGFVTYRFLLDFSNGFMLDGYSTDSNIFLNRGADSDSKGLVGSNGIGWLGESGSAYCRCYGLERSEVSAIFG